jgi:L-lactate utilization protein LutC
MLKENNIFFDKPQNPKFLLATCENLVSDEGSISFSSNQIKQKKPNELPVNMVIIAHTSQIISGKSEILSAIKNKYKKEYPSNITTIKYFEKAQEEDFTQYGSAAKNLYLILLEDL